MNPIGVVKNMSTAGKCALGALATVFVGEAILAGGLMTGDDIERGVRYGKELVDPTVVKVKEGVFKKPYKVRKSRIPFCNKSVRYNGAKEAVNKKAVKVPKNFA